MQNNKNLSMGTRPNTSSLNLLSVKYAFPTITALQLLQVQARLWNRRSHGKKNIQILAVIINDKTIIKGAMNFIVCLPETRIYLFRHTCIYLRKAA